jgi:hypothetical protein
MQCVVDGIKLILVPDNKGVSNHAFVLMLRFRDSARFLNYLYKFVCECALCVDIDHFQFDAVYMSA